MDRLLPETVRWNTASTPQVKSVYNGRNTAGPVRQGGWLMREGLEFGLLGPLAVRSGEDELPVRRGHPRALLATLLLSANRPVPVAAIAEVLWGPAPPRSAQVAIRSYIRSLRLALGQAGKERISTEPGGYMIRVGDDELDVNRFESLLASAHAAARQRHWLDAAKQAREALSCWQGEPLADIESDVLALRDAPRLSELRLQALEIRAAADLQLDRSAEVVAELQYLCAEYPLREHLHALMMLALYQCSRQADALATYQRIRSKLIEELGSEPGAELRELHQKVLAADPGLATPLPVISAGGPIASTAGAVPRQLPTAVKHFTGREHELDALTQILDQRPEDAPGTIVISTIDGMAGVGKSALAVQAAHYLARDFPDGQLFIDLHAYTQTSEPRSASEALEALLRALGVPPQRIPEDAEERAALFRQRLAGTRTLILLDNAVSEAQVRPLLPGTAGCLVLITSRRRLKGLDDAHVAALDVLPQADAIALMRAVAGPERAAADDPVLAEIVDLCGHLPLALRIAAALLRHRRAWPLEHLAALLRDEWRRISMLSDGERDLGKILDLSYRGLPIGQQRLFRFLGLIPGPDVDAYAAAALSGNDPTDAGRLLEDLVDHNLLMEHLPGRYRLHDLIRLHAQAQAEPDPARERDAALGRLLDYYLHTAARADAVITRFPARTPTGKPPAHTPAMTDQDAAWEWLRAERANLLAALQYITAEDDGERTIAFSGGLCTLLHADGPWTQGIALHAAAAAAAHSRGDQASRADALARLGLNRGLTGDFPGADRDLRLALELYRGTADGHGQAEALNLLGEVQRVTGDLPGATRALQQALHLYREAGHQPGEGRVLLQLGDVKRATGGIEEADDDLRQALGLYRTLSDRQGEADVHLRLGDLRRTTGEFLEAIRELQEALRLYRELGRRLGQANALARLGDIWQVTGNLPAAARDLQEALRLFRDLGHQLGQGNTLTFLGQVRLAAGDHTGAARHLEEAVNLFRRIGASGNHSWALNYYAAVMIAIGDARAQALYQDALRLARDASHRDDEARALEGIGECQLRVGDTENGVAHLTQALEIFQNLAMTPDADRIRTRLATVP